MIYKELINELNIHPGDRIWLSSELIQIVLQCRSRKIPFEGSCLLTEFQNAVGETGTLLLPTFSYDFSNKGYYDIKKTKGTTGALGNIALSRDDFQRTKHPMHSFAVWGQDQEMLVSLNNRHSFGIDSPFSYCISHNVKQIILGTDYIHAMTFIHYAEAVCNVPYRFLKTFRGTYVDERGTAEERIYDYAARKLEWDPRECFNRIGCILEEKGVSQKLEVSGIPIYCINLAKSFPIICEDILHNNCENIYDFCVPREQIFHH